MYPAVLFATFGTIFVLELPDKTMVATMVLSARYQRPRAVWLGAGVAFTAQVTLAVAAGGLLTLLPTRALEVVTGLLFAGGAVLLLADHDKDDDDADTALADELSTRQVFARAFVVVFIAEFGDLTQLATASLVARTGEPATVFVGAAAALWCVAGLAVLAGEAILRMVPARLVRRIAAAVFGVLSVLAFAEAVRG